ncbi:hypothetical protein MYCTH_2300559 [Thermothelomyces thermophilus ATCC 42464]|uniref:AMP-dependent synthetase/ligase domain-containing protein n=1 Tax=Thermothelomyces thermophilus (strain ATCC 42464 / BCRC 31852 / DSM 1799) TaxID=573729 RepID=G2Q7L3_THET4|nr:uncharacterized protein MYCTH_2300559 [Thermothelomyces thermophilus ATCC 42464]AEO56071.1 hypothetical protein MYCTH_2300559 [Thermothelomyces thermophilus ATCC 42464]
MKPGAYSLNEVLAVARIHPFYNPAVQYPPDEEGIRAVLESAAKEQSAPDLGRVPLTTKKDLYKTIERLAGDASPDNTYRRSAYLSITGGGSGGLPMLFATDAAENRAQRARMGNLIRNCRLIGPGDWVLTTHASGHFYRSLDLTLEILGNAGASVLSAGHNMEPAEVAAALAHYRVNVLTGDGSQVVRIVRHIASLPADERHRIRLTKIIYTSEPLTPSQRAYIADVLGPGVAIGSMLGSSEAGPWAVGPLRAPLEATAEEAEQKQQHEDASAAADAGATDFVFDTRTMVIEILDPSSLSSSSSSTTTTTAAASASASEANRTSQQPVPVPVPEPVPEGTPGIVVQTSLQRLKNPLVRYVSGDVGSRHPLPASLAAVVPEGEREHMRVLRLRGRDRRFSFKWYGAYFEFDRLAAFLRAPEWGILQWQVVLASVEASSPEVALEIRLLLPSGPARHGAAESELVRAIETFFFVQAESRHLFRIKFLKDITEFERSCTGGKVMNFVDKVH